MYRMFRLFFTPQFTRAHRRAGAGYRVRAAIAAVLRGVGSQDRPDPT